MTNKTCCKTPRLTTIKDKDGNWVRWCSQCGAQTEMNDIKFTLYQLTNNYLNFINTK